MQSLKGDIIGIGYLRYLRTTSISSSTVCRVSIVLRLKDMMTQVLVHQLRHQAIHTSTHCGDQVQNLGEVGFFVQGAPNGMNFPLNPLYRGNELLLMLRRVPMTLYYTQVYIQFASA